MRILISGMSGFIGTALAARLIKDNEVIGLPREMLKGDGLTCFVKEFNPDYIYHLAAYGNHYNQTLESEIISSNIIGTYNLLQACNDINYKGFFNFSTSSVTLPTETFYSASKKSSEAIANAFKSKYNKPIFNIRPYSVYGPGEAEFRFIPKVIHCLLTEEHMEVDENATHDWIFIDSFINALLAGITEIGSGIKVTNKQIIQILEDISGKKLNYTNAKLRTYDNPDWVCKNGVSHLSLYEGLTITYNHYAQQRP